MPTLGLGSNVGDRLSYLTAAILALCQSGALRHLRVSPVYESKALLRPCAPSEWDLPFYNVAIEGVTTLSPRDLLIRAKKIEKDIGRQQRGVWAPREIDIDILAWGSRVLTEPDLHIPHQGLLERPFALLPLLDVAPQFHYPGASENWHPPFVGASGTADATRAPAEVQSRFLAGLESISIEMCVREAPMSELVAILNCTPDSFSDGGRFTDAAQVVATLLDCAAHGAFLADLGAESTRPGAQQLPWEAEWARLEPVLERIADARNKGEPIPLLSVDTRHAEVARRSLAFGISCINDVSGFESEAMRSVAAECDADIVVMHHLCIPADPGQVLPADADPVREVKEWAFRRIAELVEYGVAEERIIFDPGIGFGKTTAQSWALIQNISAFHELNVRVMVGHSRKSFLFPVTSRPAAERDLETLGVSAFLAQKGVRYLRVHDVEMHQRALAALRACSSAL